MTGMVIGIILWESFLSDILCVHEKKIIDEAINKFINYRVKEIGEF